MPFRQFEPSFQRRGYELLKALERVKGIEPSYAAWEAAVLPLNYTRARPPNAFPHSTTPPFGRNRLVPYRSDR